MTMTNLANEKNSRSVRAFALFIFVLAFVPRALSLNAISVIDEFQWQEGTQAFINGLLSGDFPSIYCRYHPAVTDMWLIAIGLGFKYLILLLGGTNPVGFQAFLEHSTFPGYPNADFLVAERLPFALVTSISVVLVYLLTRKLFDNPVALLGAGLLALDPFYISHSRVVTPDGLLASFMTLSILSFIVYLVCERSRYYVVFSGFAAGLALLTKVPAVLLVPMVVVLTVMKHASRITHHASCITHHVADLAMWGGVALLTFFCLWPAMWVAPVGTIQRMVADMAEDTGGGWHQYFMGRRTQDPGLLFYPVVLLFKTTPLTLIGAVASPVFFSRASRRHETRDKKREIGWTPPALTSLVMLVIGILVFTLFISFGPTKFDRFLVPIFPSVDILAALGLYELAKVVSAKRGKPLKALALLTFIVQAGFALPHHPYFLSFYNPLVGGAVQAPKVLFIGWGEAFEQAGRYLNRKENAAELKVAAQYPASFGPYFVGQTLAISRMYPTDIWPWLPADYIVFYINGAQRNVPDPDVVSYFRSLELEHTVRAKGLEYAWIYRGPQFILSEAPTPQYPTQADLAGKVLFLGYDLYGPAESNVESGDTLQVTTYWRCLEEMDKDYSIYVRLEDEAGHLWGQTDNWPAKGFLPTSQWREGLIVRDEYSIEILAGTPPGDYRLRAGMYSILEGGRTRVLGRWEASQRTVRVVKPPTPPSVESLEIQHLVQRSLVGRMELLGYNLSPITFRPGDPLPLTLFWRAESDLDEDYFVLLHLRAEDGTGWKLHQERPAGGAYPTTLWEQGEVVREQLDARILADVPSGRYTLTASLADVGSGEEVGLTPLAELTVEGRPRTFEVPPIQHPLEANLGDQVALLGYALDATELKAGGTLSLTLYWKALAEMDTSYTVFVHILDAESEIRGQRDSLPGGGTLPTTGWLPGEVIVDQYEVPVQPDAPLGQYVIEVGMYRAETGKRLSVINQEEHSMDGRVLLGEATVER
jgi:4-amino-4-deoxy-L-arabinose transferase-like glycosyltransferase